MFPADGGQIRTEKVNFKQGMLPTQDQMIVRTQYNLTRRSSRYLIFGLESENYKYFVYTIQVS